MTNTREERVELVDELIRIARENECAAHFGRSYACEDLDAARNAVLAIVEPSPDVWEALLNEIFDFLGGCDGASELRARILALLPDPPKVTVEEDRA